MVHQMTLAQLGEVLASRFSISLSHFLEGGCQRKIGGVGTDSRVLRLGEVFVALRGDRFDGHHFVTIAADQGAAAVVVDRHFLETMSWEDWQRVYPDVALLPVPDTLAAYQAIGRWWRQQFQIPVIAVTGSVGKTTTKELVAAVLSHWGQVLKSPANHNNEIGVPKTLLTLTPEHDYAVVEMGMRGLGEIACLAKIAEPTVALITNVGTAHIGRLGSEAAIAQAKCELLAELGPDAIAVLNQDDLRLSATAATVWQGSVITYGLSGGQIHGHYCKCSDNAETLTIESTSFPLPLPGRHNALNLLAALGVAEALGLDWRNLPELPSITLPGGRSQRIDLSGDVVLLDETYNAGLESMQAALALLGQTAGQRRIAVLGTMKELGTASERLHRLVGETAQVVGVDVLLVVADELETAAIVEAATQIPDKRVYSGATAETCEVVVQHLLELVQPGDRILFKASNSVGLDRVVRGFCDAWQGPRTI